MQCLGPYRLGEKVHSASLHRLDSHGDVAVASQEDNWLGITVSGESTLQVETARSRRAHIEDQAAGAVQYVGFKQFARRAKADRLERSEEHTSELQSLMRISYAVFCLK